MPLTVANRAEALEFIFSRINYELLTADKYPTQAFKLDRMRHFLSLLGNPQERIPAVHIAGTKGKGSTAEMTAEILSAAGYKTGLFTSPHVSEFEERIRVDGRSPTAGVFVDLVNRLLPVIERMDEEGVDMRPTYFEIATALAWLHFLQERADVAVLEVGVGGRLDATNLCSPAVTAITSISFDHTALLGDTLPKIAAEKAGIVKPGVPVISGVDDADARAVIAEICRQRQSPLYELHRDIRYQQARPFPHHVEWESDVTPQHGLIRVETPFGAWDAVPVALPGEHQSHNAALAMGIVSVLREQGWKISEGTVEAGMQRVRCPLRIEVVSRRPTVVLDAAHNVASVEALVKTLNNGIRARRRILLFAASRDKDVRGMLSTLLPAFDQTVLTRYQSNPRSVPETELAEIAKSLGDFSTKAISELTAAYQQALAFAAEEDLLCVTGSFFVAAELRDDLLRAIPALMNSR